MDALRHAVGHVIPASTEARRGVAVWYAFVAASVTDPDASDLLAKGKRAQEAEVTRLIGNYGTGIDAPAAARRLIALADGMASRVLIGDLEPGEAEQVINHAIKSECRLTEARGDTPEAPSDRR